MGGMLFVGLHCCSNNAAGRILGFCLAKYLLELARLLFLLGVRLDYGR